MERLTENYKGKYLVMRTPTKGVYTDYDRIRDIDNCIQKLGKLEDLQDELGIPLEVLFKAFKSKIKLNKYNFLFVIEHLIKIEDEFCFVVVDERNAFVVESIKIKDYGKTWWLEEPKEKLKNDI